MDTIDRIEKLMADRQIKQSEFARGINARSSSVSDWFKRKSTSYMKYIKEIAVFFDVSIEYLLNGDETEENVQELQGAYFSLAKEAQESGIHPDDIKAALEMIRKIKGE